MEHGYTYLFFYFIFLHWSCILFLIKIFLTHNSNHTQNIANSASSSSTENFKQELLGKYHKHTSYFR